MHFENVNYPRDALIGQSLGTNKAVAAKKQNCLILHINQLEFTTHQYLMDVFSIFIVYNRMEALGSCYRLAWLLPDKLNRRSHVGLGKLLSFSSAQEP